MTLRARRLLGALIVLCALPFLIIGFVGFLRSIGVAPAQDRGRRPSPPPAEPVGTCVAVFETSEGGVLDRCLTMCVVAPPGTSSSQADVTQVARGAGARAIEDGWQGMPDHGACRDRFPSPPIARCKERANLPPVAGIDRGEVRSFVYAYNPRAVERPAEACATAGNRMVFEPGYPPVTDLFENW